MMKFYFQEFEKKFISENRTGESADAARKYSFELEQNNGAFKAGGLRAVNKPTLINTGQHKKCTALHLFALTLTQSVATRS